MIKKPRHQVYSAAWNAIYGFNCVMFGRSSVQLPSPTSAPMSTTSSISSLLFTLRLSRASYLVGRCHLPLCAATLSGVTEPTHYPRHTFHRSTYLAHPPQPTPIIYPKPSPKLAGASRPMTPLPSFLRGEPRRPVPVERKEGAVSDSRPSDSGVRLGIRSGQP